MAPRRRKTAKATTGDEASPPNTSNPVSSDDEEANEDLSLAVVESARRRKAQKRRDRNGAGDEPLAPDPSSTSSGDVAVQPETASEVGKQKKRKKKKIEYTEFFADLGDDNDDHGEQADDKRVVKEEELVMNRDDDQGTKEEGLGPAESAVTIVNAAADNAVLRKLLRCRRYFDPGESAAQTCFNCNVEGHIAVNCPMEKRQKPCFICGLFGHIGKQCKQGRDCFICKARGHHAKDCPDKQKKVSAGGSSICLRCGDTGHDMFLCRNDYPSDDMKEVQCYMCKQNGHLCCVDFTEASPKKISCYNCAGSGHSGLGCGKPSGEDNGIASPASCFKCGEEGHFARACKKVSKFVRSFGESSTPRKHTKGNKYNHGSKSVPNDFGKAKKRKNLAYENGREWDNFKPRTRGGWSADDPGDLHNWKSKRYTDEYPRTPLRKNQRDHPYNSNENYSKSMSYNNNKSVLGTPNHQIPSSSYQERWSASKSANSNRRYW